MYTLGNRYNMQAAKKGSFLNGLAIKRGGGLGAAVRGERFFLFVFFILLPFKNEMYFTLDNLWAYGYIT